MIISRSSLQAVLCTNKTPPILDNVHFQTDGTAVAFDGKMLGVVSPVRTEIKEQIPIVETPGVAATMSSETIREVLKNMPVDKKFHGLLEHTDLTPEGTFKLTDGKRQRSLAGKPYSREYIDYRAVIRQIGKPVVRVVLNRHRLKAMLDFLDKACPDGANESPAYLEFSESNDVTIRTVNPMNGQRALGYMASYKNEEGKWLEPDEWEQSLVARPKATARLRYT